MKLTCRVSSFGLGQVLECPPGLGRMITIILAESTSCLGLKEYADQLAPFQPAELIGKYQICQSQTGRVWVWTPEELHCATHHRHCATARFGFRDQRAARRGGAAPLHVENGCNNADDVVRWWC